jgi:mRNA interferase HigB
MIAVHVIVRRTLKEFCERHEDARGALDAWYYELKHAKWRSPADIKKQYRSASFLCESRIVFNICGNKYRLVVKTNYPMQIIFVRFVGTHKEYDRINPEVISWSQN